MGLDMYLYAEHYVKKWDHNPPSQQFTTTLVDGNGKLRTDINPERVKYVTEEVGYWRKANQIHMWFVNECQKGIDECQRTYVQPEKLIELRDICKRLLESHSKEDALDELPPAEGGFFFGTYGPDYVDDEYYWQDLQDTLDILSKLNLGDDPDLSSEWYAPEYYYQSSW
jgi:hypothetical protein